MQLVKIGGTESEIDEVFLKKRNKQTFSSATSYSPPLSSVHLFSSRSCLYFLLFSFLLCFSRPVPPITLSPLLFLFSFFSHPSFTRFLSFLFFDFSYPLLSLLFLVVLLFPFPSNSLHFCPFFSFFPFPLSFSHPLSPLSPLCFLC